MVAIFKDTLIDTLKVLPFLLLAFLIIELFEHKFSDKSRDLVSKSGKFGPIIGGILGVIPQCGFSVMGTNLYITRIISLGTLISIYLSTSDEMIPVMLSEDVAFSQIFKILLVKVIFAFIWGFIIDLIFSKFEKNKESYDICDNDHCHCEDGIIKSVIHHTFNTIIFIFITTFLLNLVMTYLGEDLLSKILFKGNIVGSFISSLIGLIPNCGASVVITELYINGTISFGTLIGGLLSSSGVALLVLFRENKDIHENLSVLGIIYFIGSLSGLLIDLFLIIF